MVSPIGRLHLDLESTDQGIVVHFSGGKVRMDEEYCQSTQDRLLNVAEQQAQGPVILDMGNVVALSSVALGALVKLHRRLKALGRRLTLCNLSPEVYEVFEVTRLDTLLDIRPVRQGVTQKGA
jgi:anti-sigma B factor antagonist